MKKGWELKKLGEVYDVRDGTHDSPKYIKEGYALITSKNLKSNTINYTNINYISELDYININKRSKVDIGDVLFAMIGTIGNPIVVKTEPNFAIKNVALFKVPQNQNSYFLKYYLDSSLVIDLMTKDAKGATQKFVGLGYLRNFNIPLPPLHEQERIVSILDQAFAAIDKAKANVEKNLNNVKELFENATTEIFIQKGIDWEEKKLGEFAIFRNGINYTKGSKGEKIKIVGVKDFQDSYWVPDNDLVEVSLDAKINETDLLKEGDILAVRSNGNPLLIGRTLIAGILNEKVSHSGFTIRIRLNSKTINPNYLCHFLKTQETRKKLVESGIGVGIKSLNQGSLSSLEIPFPKSLKEQDAIINKLESISLNSQRLKDSYYKKIKNLEELKKSILEKAFSGQLSESGFSGLIDVEDLKTNKGKGQTQN